MSALIKLIAVTILLSSMQANAGGYGSRMDAVGLLSALRDTGDVKFVWAAGYIIGIVDLGSTGHVKNMDFCVPDNLKSLEVVDIVKTYIEKRPQLMIIASSDLVAMALYESFPCKR